MAEEQTLPESADQESYYDEYDSDFDSLLSDQIETAPLTGDMINYKFENGRRYHAYKEGSYFVPNDNVQNEQLDIFHHVYSLALDGKRFLAPIGTTPHNILDLGTGTGIWASDVADAFPSAQVIGNDLSPIQPRWTPPNCKFEIDDFNQIPWSHPLDHFDFIHARACYGSIPDWPRFLSTIYNHLIPGGWFESVETGITWNSDDGSIPETSPVHDWLNLLVHANEEVGRSFRTDHDEVMRELGFENVCKETYKIPTNPWPEDDKKLQELGNYNLLNLLQAIEGYSLALFTRVLKWEPLELNVLIEGVKKDFANKDHHGYIVMTVVYGQKPA